jgi:general secretion pathway protein J
MKSSAGLTLIELMVALVVVAVLGILSFRAVATATETRNGLADELQRRRDIGRFMQRVELDLAQIEARPGARGGGAAMTLASGSDGAVLEFSFLRGDGANHRLRRYGYRFEANRIVLLRWPGSDAASAPGRSAVLADVKGLRFRFYQADGRKSDSWPPEVVAETAATVATVAAALPLAIEIELELADVGTIRRLLPLR